MYEDMMAYQTDKSYKADLTTCSICFDTLKVPKYLPCLHCFCEGCIKTHIISFDHNENKDGVTCPLCRMFVSKPDGTSIEEWPTMLPTNDVLYSLIQMNESTSGPTQCAACERENVEETAKSWCINCGEKLCELYERFHRKNKASSKHKLVDITSPELTNLAALHYVDMFCKEHPDKTVEAYCNFHSAVCCLTCVTLKHRNCRNVCSVEEAAHEKKGTKEIDNFQESMTEIQKSLEEMVLDRDENLKSFQKDIQDIEIELDRLKSDMMSEISKMEQKVQSEIENEREEMKGRITAIAYNLTLFQTNLKYANSAQFLQTMERLMEQKSMLENFMKEKKQRLQDIRVSMDVSKKLVEMQATIESFGKLKIKRTIKNATPKEDVHDEYQRSPIVKSSVRIDNREPPSDYYLHRSGNWCPIESRMSSEFRLGTRSRLGRRSRSPKFDI